MASSPPPEAFASTPLVILVADLAGYAAAFRTRSDADMAAFLDRYYTLAEGHVVGQGGRVVKFMGDAVLAVFPPAAAAAAVGAAVLLGDEVARLAGDTGVTVELGGNVHLGPVVEAELGGTGRRDVVGRAVNQAFVLGRGPGIRISETVYRRLPSGDRTPWTRNRPPAVYSLAAGGGARVGRRGTHGERGARW
jgi:class 3 adenylate cyclase